MKRKTEDRRNDSVITEDNQRQPDVVRQAFLNGVMVEAHVQGYSKAATGRLLVLALRTWEGR